MIRRMYILIARIALRHWSARLAMARYDLLDDRTILHCMARRDYWLCVYDDLRSKNG